jgi:hypothetical protein
MHGKNIPDEVQAHSNLLRIWGVVNDGDLAKEQSVKGTIVTKVKRGASNKVRSPQRPARYTI